MSGVLLFHRLLPLSIQHHLFKVESLVIVATISPSLVPIAFPQASVHTSALWMLCGLPAIVTIMGLFKSLKGDHSTTHDKVDSSPPGPPPVREPTYQPPSGPPPSHQFHNYSADGPPPGGNEYAPPPEPPPGWQKTPNETPTAAPDADEEPPPYQYVIS